LLVRSGRRRGKLNEKSPAATWVDAAAGADGIDLTSIRSAGDISSLAEQAEAFNRQADDPRYSLARAGQSHKNITKY
jgi:PIN domain nuclease of toxin-antitoxin system